MDKEIQQAIIESIEILLHKVVSKLDFNYMVDGQITAINSGIYTVNIDGELYDMKARTGLTLNIGDIVQVIIKNGDWSKKFIDDIRLT